MAAGENDVVTKAHSTAVGINNGAAFVHTNIHGTSQSIGPSGANGLAGFNVTQTSGELNAWLWDRFDDINYYAGSGV